LKAAPLLFACDACPDYRNEKMLFLFGFCRRFPNQHQDVNNNLTITPATKYINVVIPAKAGIQAGTGCRIMLTVRN
jgi:hypothetical protein